MYFSGLMELTVVGTVQLVIFYGGEGEYGKAVLAAAPLAPGVLRKGKELLPKKGTNLADDVAKRVAPKGIDDVVRNVGDDVTKWLGIDAKVITNEFGDTIVESADGLRQIRFDSISITLISIGIPIYT